MPAGGDAKDAFGAGVRGRWVEGEELKMGCGGGLAIPFAALGLESGLWGERGLLYCGL